MRKGEIAKFTLQPEFAYGEAGKDPVIPKSAVLIFEIELISWVSKDDLFGDECVIKSLMEEGSGWKNAKKGEEVRVSFVVTAEGGAILDERKGVDYFIGSTAFGIVSKVVDKAITGMNKGEKCSLWVQKGYTFPEEHGDVTINLELEDIYEISDVSLRKDETVMKKQIKDGEGYDKPKDGQPVVLRVESATDGSLALPGFVPSELRFTSGNGQVCDAIESAALDMKRGERALVTCTVSSKCVDAQLGLTKVEAEKVVFTLEMLEFEKGKEQWSMTGEDKAMYALSRKDMGAQLFKRKRFELALDKYNKVIEMLNQTDGFSEEGKRRAGEVKRVAELNTAACFLQLGDPTSALSVCNTVIKADRNNVKAIFRRAKAHHCRGEYVDAERDILRTLELEPGHAEATSLLVQVRRAMKVADKESKNTFAKMCTGFGKIGSGREKAPVQEPAAKPQDLEEEQPADMVACTFRVERKTEPGEEVVVMGACEELGEWNLEKSLVMKREASKPDWEAIRAGKPQSESHFWSVCVQLPEAHGRLEYKYAVRGPTGATEEGSRHAVQLSSMGGSRCKCSDEWRS